MPDETKVLAKVIRLLESVTIEERQRIISYLWSRFTIPSSTVSG